jgi:hypothetical protein
VGFSEKQWESIRSGAEAFAHQWAAQAYGLGVQSQHLLERVEFESLWVGCPAF